MKDVHSVFTDTVKLGKRGQITLPKKIRDEDGFVEGDTMIVTHMPGGDLILQKQYIQTPEDRMLDAVKKMPRFDWRKAWEEVHAERRKSDR